MQSREVTALRDRIQRYETLLEVIQLYSPRLRSGGLYLNPLQFLPFPTQSLILDLSPLETPFLEPMLSISTQFVSVLFMFGVIFHSIPVQNTRMGNLIVFGSCPSIVIFKRKLTIWAASFVHYSQAIWRH